MGWSYKLGSKAIEMLTANAKEFTRAASMWCFHRGALTSNYGWKQQSLWKSQTAKPGIVIQSILDGVLPKLIP